MKKAIGMNAAVVAKTMTTMTTTLLFDGCLFVGSEAIVCGWASGGSG
jgi:hypothetical protein